MQNGGTRQYARMPLREECGIYFLFFLSNSMEMPSPPNTSSMAEASGVELRTALALDRWVRTGGAARQACASARIPKNAIISTAAAQIRHKTFIPIFLNPPSNDFGFSIHAALSEKGLTGTALLGIERHSAPRYRIMSAAGMRMLTVPPEASDCGGKLLLADVFFGKCMI